MANLKDKWNKNNFSIYTSEEKTTLKLIENINNFVGEELAKEVDNKTDLNGDHKGSWQGLNRPTLSEEGMRATVEQLASDYVNVNTSISSINNLLNKKSEYPIENWEGDNVKNVIYKYGDVRRYGAKCNGTNDDSAFFQITFDICGLNGKPIYIPSENILISNPIILHDIGTHMYKVEGMGVKTLDKNLICESEFLFVGEKYYLSTPYFTKVNFNMNNVNIRCTNNKDVTIFKAIELYHSLIQENKIYYPSIVIEGAFSVWTNFTKNRVQGLKRALITSSSTRTGFSFDSIRLQLMESNYDYSILGNFLVLNESTGVYTIKSNDSYIKNNYLSGSSTRATLPTLLEIDAIDNDCNFEDNWIEFYEYLTKPLFHYNTVEEGKPIYGTLFVNNTIQRLYRIFEENTIYNSWVFENNKFMSFNRVTLSSQFPSAISPKFLTKKCGAFVVDRTDGDVAVLTNIIVNNNYFSGGDYSFYIDVGTSTKTHTIIERGTKILQGITGIANPPYIRINLQGSNVSYTKSYFGLLDNLVYTTIPTITDETLKYINVFLGQRLFIGSDVYIMGIGENNLPLMVKIN